jgi:hypothetical protein
VLVYASLFRASDYVSIDWLSYVNVLAKMFD